MFSHLLIQMFSHSLKEHCGTSSFHCLYLKKKILLDLIFIADINVSGKYLNSGSKFILLTMLIINFGVIYAV